MRNPPFYSQCAGKTSAYRASDRPAAEGRQVLLHSASCVVGGNKSAEAQTANYTSRNQEVCVDPSRDEVHSLATRTQDSTPEIQTLMERLQNATNQAVIVMNASKPQAASKADQAKTAADQLITANNYRY